MKQVVIEKQIELDHEFNELNDLSAFQHLQTTALKDGLECSGIIQIRGTGVLDSHEIPVEESIDLNIFAPFYRLSEKEAFEVLLSDSKFKLEGQLLKCTFTFDVNGLKTEDELEIESIECDNDEGSIEDLLDDSQVLYEKVRYAVTLENDTYASIAQRNQIPENLVRKLNSDKILRGRELILLPFS